MLCLMHLLHSFCITVDNCCSKISISSVYLLLFFTFLLCIGITFAITSINVTCIVLSIVYTSAVIIHQPSLLASSKDNNTLTSCNVLFCNRDTRVYQCHIVPSCATEAVFLPALYAKAISFF